jgi:hypothetical protein
MPRFLLGLSTLLSFGLLSFGAQAQECKPTYKIRYEVCAAPSHPQEAKAVTTDWILVNKGARTVNESLCTEYIPTLQAQKPQAKNIRLEKLENRDASFRGLGKRDVYCKFEMEDLVTVAMESPTCGIATVDSECVKGLTKDELILCASKTPQTIDEKWLKAACLANGLKFAAQVQGLDEATYSSLKFQLQILRESLALNRTPEDAKLLRWIRSETRTQ